MEILYRLVLSACAIAMPSLAVAATAFITTGVDRTFVMDDSFGECMFRPTVDLREKGLDCGSSWITLDCAGTLGGSRATASRKYDEVLLARITGGSLRVRVDDQKKINGWCYADRIQSLGQQ